MMGLTWNTSENRIQTRGLAETQSGKHSSTKVRDWVTDCFASSIFHSVCVWRRPP